MEGRAKTRRKFECTCTALKGDFSKANAARFSDENSILNALAPQLKGGTLFENREPVNGGRKGTRALNASNCKNSNELGIHTLNALRRN